MTSAEIYQWMENPQLLTKSSLIELKQMVDDFPCFHAARLLYLKNLAVIKDVRLDNEVKKMSIFVPDRRRLFMLLESEIFSSLSKDTVRAIAEDKPKEAIAKKEISKEPEPKIKPKPERKPVPVVAAADYANWLEANVDDIISDDGKKAELQHQDLIDSFIESENKLNKILSPTVVLPEKTEKESENKDAHEPEHAEKDSMDDSYFTETLARVYVRQKRYDKALEIIRTISLKYPEKNVYFADQIRYLERIINIKK